MAVMAGDAEMFRIASSSTIGPPPQNACNRIRNCFSSVFRTRPGVDDDRGREHVLPTSVQSPVLSPALVHVQLAPVPTKNSIVRLWIKAAYKLRNVGNHNVYAIAQVGEKEYRTKVVQGGQETIWEPPRNFSFKLRENDQKVEIRVMKARVKSNDESIGVVDIPFWLLTPGAKVSFQLAVIDSADTVSGEVVVEARLESPETLTFEKGSNVQIWSESQQNWADTFVEDVYEEESGHDVSAPQGSVVVHYTKRSDNTEKKQGGVISPDRLSRLRKMYDWVCVTRGDEIPRRCLRSGYTSEAGDMYVGRNEFGECGKVTLTDELGPRCMLNLWCHGHNSTGFAEMLVLRRGFRASWQKIKKDGAIPEGAVSVNVIKEGAVPTSSGKGECVFVGRNDRQEAGFVTVTTVEGEVTKRMQEMRCHGCAAAKQGEVLVVNAASEEQREFELRIESCEGLTHHEYMFGDRLAALTNAAQLQPYIRVTVSGATNGEDEVWRSGARKASGTGCLDVLECMHFGVDSDKQLNEVQIKVAAYNSLGTAVITEKIRNAIRKDPSFGEGSVPLTEESLGAVQHVQLERIGTLRTVHREGTVLVTVRELQPNQYTFRQEPTTLIQQWLPPARYVKTHLNDLTTKFLQCARGETEFHKTVTLCLETLVSVTGGMLIAIPLDQEKFVAGLDASDHEDGTELLRKVVGRVSAKKMEYFKDWLAAASTQDSPADVWTEYDLERLNLHRLHDAQINEQARKLIDRPKGGCLVLSKKGTPTASAAKFEFGGICPYRFPYEKHVTARHHEALWIAYWMSCQHTMGVVLARWENGRIYVILCPEGQMPEVCLLVDSRRHSASSQ